MIAALALAAPLAMALAAAGAADTPAPPSGSQETRAAPAADGEIAEEARRVALRIERVRGLRVSPVPPAVRADAAARREAAARRASAAIDPSHLAARGRAWSDLGLGGPETPAELLRRLAADLDGMAYDPEGGRLLIDPGRLTDADFAPRDSDDETSSLLMATGVRPDEPLLVHVLMHALEASRGGNPLAGTTDALLADSGWAEGEANLVAILYLFEGLGLHDDVVQHGLDPGSVVGGILLPPSLDRLSGVEGSFLDFVYREGYAQVARAFRSGGWVAVDRAAAARRTTRDLLHPDRSPLPRLPAAPPKAPPGFALADADSLGEQGIVALVSTLTGKDNLGMIAADGWRGDLLCRFEPEGGSPSQGFTLWVSRWSSDEKAADFVYGLQRCLEARFPGVPLADLRAGTKRLAAGGNVFLLTRSAGEVRFRVAPEAIDSKLSPSELNEPRQKAISSPNIKKLK